MLPLFDKIADWWRAHQQGRQNPEAAVVVGFDDETVWCTAPGQARQEIAWADLRCVRVHTTDEGPFQPDVFWHLETDSDACVIYPGGATGSGEVLERLQELPGFDNLALIEAMSSTDNASFTCWQPPSS